MHPFQHTDLVFVSQLWNQQHCCLWKQSYVKLYANKFGMGLYDVGIYGGGYTYLVLVSGHKLSGQLVA